MRLVEVAVVADERLEAVGLPVDPVDHVAAVGRAERRDAVLVEERVLRERRVEPLHEVLERRAAPVAADGVGERLAVAGRAVEIDHDRRVAVPREGLGVPPVVKVVAEGALRPAVDEEGDRGARPRGRGKAGRLDEPAVDLVPLGAGERELLATAPNGSQPPSRR